MNLQKEVWEANKLLPELGLVKFTWGNVSAIDRENGLMYIKPSGIDYEKLRVNDIVIVDTESGNYRGDLKPSSDTQTHLEIYRNFEDIQSIVHTHSTWATIWAQMGKDIPVVGTTHADYFLGSIPCSRKLKNEEIANDYECNTGKVINETIKKMSLDSRTGAILVREHGPFCWASSSKKAVENAAVLEEVAKMAYFTTFGHLLHVEEMNEFLLKKHYYRKHGRTAYYGQVLNK